MNAEGLHRRRLLQLASGAVALGALGGGLWVRRRRVSEALESQTITAYWPETRMYWLLPSLDRVPMVVPDRPHAIREVIDAEHRAQVKCRRTFHVTTSARRFRDDAYGASSAPGVRRILCIGDSITFGWGVEGEQSWPARLRVELEARGVRAEVINAGVPAMKTDAMAQFLERVGPSLELDGVVFARRPLPERDRWNSFASCVARAVAACPKARFHVLLPPASTFDVGVFADHAEQLAQVQARVSVPVTDLTGHFVSERPSRGVVMEGTARSHLVRSLETGEVLVRGSGTKEALDAEVYAFLEAHPEEREPFFFDQGHMAAEGCELVGAAMAEELVARGWFA